MCLLDTADGALMLSLYVQPAANFLPAKRDSTEWTAETLTDEENEAPVQNHRDPIAFLYYSIVLTCLTVVVAIVIGIIQLLTLVLNVAEPTGRFWDGVQTAGDYYDAIGGGICGCFIIFGGLSVVVYKPWKRWILNRHGRGPLTGDEEGYPEESQEEPPLPRPETPMLSQHRNGVPAADYGSTGKKNPQVGVKPVGEAS